MNMEYDLDTDEGKTSKHLGNGSAVSCKAFIL